jgi:hypothetical protein
MALFKKNNATAAERDLDSLRHRRALLMKQKEIAEGALEKAIADRRKILLEADIEQNGGREPVKALIERLRDENESIVDALSAIDGKICDAEVRIAAEKDETARRREVEKRQAALAAARNLLDRSREINAELVDALALLRSCGPACAAAHGNLEYFANEMPGGIRAAFTEAAAYCVMVAEGTAPINAEPVAPQAPPAAAPAVERMAIFLRGPSRWVEPDGEHTAGPHNIVSPPKRVAELALQFGHAVPAHSETAKHLRSLADPHPGWFSPASCLDISQPIPEPATPEPRATVPLCTALFRAPAPLSPTR